MTAINGVALRPNNEAPRQARAGAKRGTTQFINHGEEFDTTIGARLQWLAARHGVIGAYAALLATIAWEASHAR